MPERLDGGEPVVYRRDIPTEFEQEFETVPQGDPASCPPEVATVKCRHCPAEWDTVLEQMASISQMANDGSGRYVGRTVILTVRKGVRNSLMAHAAVHAKGYMPTIRRRR